MRFDFRAPLWLIKNCSFFINRLTRCGYREFSYSLQHLFSRRSRRPGADLRKIAVNVVDHFARVDSFFRRIEGVFDVFHHDRFVFVGRSPFFSFEQQKIYHFFCVMTVRKKQNQNSRHGYR